MRDFSPDKRNPMKLLTTCILATFLSTLAFSQNEALEGVWYSAQQDFFEFKPKYWSMESGKDLHTMGFTVFQQDSNRLWFLNKYYDSKDYNIIKIDYTKSYEFILKAYTKDSLVLAPVSEYARHFFNDRAEIHFFRKEHFVDPSIAFEKLVFRTTDCLGECPVINFQLDKDRNIMYSGYSYKDSTLTGDFSGTISEQDMDKLLQQLKNCQLQTLRWRRWRCCDAPIVTLIIYFNGQRKYLQSMVMPRISDDLVDFLYGLVPRATLTPRKEKFEFEE